MYIDFIICLLIFFNTYPTTHQLSVCKYDEICTPVNKCPIMLRYTQPGPGRNIAKLRKSICGYLHTTYFVCCPSPLSKFTRSLKNMKDMKPTRRSLLPQYCGNPMVQNKIFGGTPTPIGAYPWVVGLGYTERNRAGFFFQCAGSIISERYILTAAHCVHRAHLGKRKLEVIHLGVWNMASEKDCKDSTNGITCFRHLLLGIEEVVTHPQFNQEAELANDIALIRLNRTLNFDTNDDLLIAPVCLPPSDMNVRSTLDGRKAIAAGWGFTEFKNYSNILTSVEIPIVNNRHCLERFQSRFSSKQLCAGGVKGEDTCMGDSGGPLVLVDKQSPLHRQVGIVSFGRTPCGEQSAFGVYTSVARYRNWIERNLKP